jgi:hypothetical protein
MRPGRLIRGGTGALVAIALLGALPAAAHAIYDPLASGTAKLTLAPSFRSLLRQQGIKLSGRQGATVSAQRTATLPVRGGEADPTTAKGSFELGGELLFATASRKITLTFLTVNTKATPFYAKVGGGQQKVAKAATAAFETEGFTYTYSAQKLTLSKKTATRLDKRLKTKAFEPDQLLGSLKVSGDPATVAILPQGKATLSLDPAFAAKLSSLFVSRNPVFPAEHQADVFSLPIAGGGRLAPDGSQGTLRTEGAIELLQLGAGQLFWRELWFEPGQSQALAEAELDPSPPFPGKQGQVGALALGQGQVSSDPLTRTITISGAPLSLTGLSAQDLNEAFSRPLQKGELFAPGEAVGTVGFSAVGQ